MTDVLYRREEIEKDTSMENPVSRMKQGHRKGAQSVSRSEEYGKKAHGLWWSLTVAIESDFTWELYNMA